MALDRWARKISGIWTEVSPVTSSAGSSDGGRIAALDLSTGKFHASLLPSGVGADLQPTLLSETVASGGIINFHNVSGTLKARNADASGGNGKAARGYVPAGGASGATVDVYFDGTLAGLSGLTPGAEVFLSASVPGGLTHTCPTGTGVVAQSLGVALSTTEVSFELGEVYVQDA